ncbi:hypothetical protein VTK26DRAFT_8359 [Humicola hyalothermophila]
MVSEYLQGKGKGKDQQLRAIRDRKGPLTLLDLPVDILQLIAKEITHTNDLTALALTNSALYNLAIPLIYSRFDIVWPEGNTCGTESKSVDALTYGLSTLCLGNAFARTVGKPSRAGTNPSHLVKLAHNDYAKYTKKFSLGNGPSDWVVEYMIHKESGRMLGILVAMAIQKMKNLETFIWDMPTGVLSQVFMALASLADRPEECKLSRVWVRWHDNSEALVSPASPNGATAAPAVVNQGSHLTAVGISLGPGVSHPPPRPPVKYSEYHCEYPTFSCLPPIKSLTVLDIDEVGYLDEMAVLIERSKDILQELRVGISAAAANRAFAQTWDGDDLKQIDHKASWPGESTIGDRRLGGVLGVLVGKIYDIRKRRTKDKAASGTSSPPAPLSTPAEAGGQVTPSVNGALSPNGAAVHQHPAAEAREKFGVSKESKPGKSGAGSRKRLDGKLKLHTLELERVALSLQVCRHAIDWSTLTNLTLLDCAQHDNLWKMLRKQFPPTPMGTDSGNLAGGRSHPPSAPLQYHLALKYIHTDSTTLSLITLIKETLAPNSLEVLFLQDRKRPSQPTVMLDTIFRGAIKRHHASLRKLLLDSSAKVSGGPPSENSRWRRWTLTTDVLLYITSGRMHNLRELAASIDYRDWHTFLQRLPNMPQLRSLNIPHVADYPMAGFEPKELAHQLVDIITLRPEIRLCYIGIGAKCFEILEYRDTGGRKKRRGVAAGGGSVGVTTSASGASTPNTSTVTAAPVMAPPGFQSGGSAVVMASSGDVAGGNPDGGEEEEEEEEEEEDTTDEDDGDDEDEEEEGWGGGSGGGGGGAGNYGVGNGNVEDDDEEDDDDDDDEEEEHDDDEEEEEEEEDDDDDDTPTTAPSETQSENGAASAVGGGGGAGLAGVSAGGGNEEDEADDEEEDDDGFVEPGRGGVKLKLREILFYDDKVAIFKARHGKL